MATTLLQLRDGAKIHANKQSTPFLTDTEWTNLINKGYRALWQDVVAIDPSFRVSTEASYALTGSANAHTLPADFMEVSSVRRDPDTTREVYLTPGGVRFPRTELTYRLQGTLLFIEPLERSAGTYKLRYIPQAPVLTNDGDTMDAELEQFREYIELKAAIFALASEESSITELAALLGDEVARVKRWASRRRSYDGDVVEDVRPRGRRRGLDLVP